MTANGAPLKDSMPGQVQGPLQDQLPGQPMAEG